MTKRLIIFEDNTFANFFPLTLNRPVFSLRSGAFAFWERIAARFDGYEAAFSCREELADLAAGDLQAPVNRVDYRPGDRLVFVNGRLRLGNKLAAQLKGTETNQIFVHGQRTAAVVIVDPLEDISVLKARFSGETPSKALGVKADIIQGEFDFYHYLWDIVRLNGDDINLDYAEHFSRGNLPAMLREADVDSSARLLSQDNLAIAPGAIIGAGTVIDNRHGAVIIDHGAIIGPLSYIQGPAYIGKDTQVFRGYIREGCSFGPLCRIGGEVEESVFQGYTNKYHDGFMGHTYLGSWVNLGAMTTNSDLKNNYRNIRVSLNGKTIDTGQMKIGCFIGDHSKTGIGTLINTGVNIGFSCNIFGGTLVTSGEVASFSWGDETGYEIFQMEKAMEVARAAMIRRNILFSERDEKIFRLIFEKSTAGR